jgi:glycosyltransferase involved in cell wall biosynthesis
MNVIRENYNVPDNKIIIYPSGGVDINLFRKIDKDEAKEYLKLDKKTKYIGYVSRVETDKGYDTFVEAINILSNDKKYKNYKYIILGGGSEEKILNKLIADYKLEDKIIMLNGLSREELVYLYNSLELFVFPTKRKSESLGLVGLEAFACKTLTITSNNEGPLSYAENKRNAYVFKQGDATDLVDKINTILDLDEKGKEKLIKNAYNKALEYDSSKMDNILKKIFK